MTWLLGVIAGVLLGVGLPANVFASDIAKVQCEGLSAALAPGEPSASLRAALGRTGEAPPETVDGRETDRRPAETERESLPADVQAALDWEARHGRLDFLLLPVPEGTTVAVPHLRDNDSVRLLYDRLRSSYSRLQLVSHYPGAFRWPDRMQLELARALLQEKFVRPASSTPRDLEETLAALAVFHTKGTTEDAALLQPPPDWGRLLPHVLAGSRARIARRRRPGSVATPEETRQFVEWVFQDMLRLRPELAAHISHSNRVADLVVRLRNAQLVARGESPMTPAAEASIRIAAAVHDLGKAFWPSHLLAKTMRLAPAEFAASHAAIAAAFEAGSLDAVTAGLAVEAITALNRRVGPESPLLQPTPAQRELLEKLVADGILEREHVTLLLAKDIALSAAERAEVNEHPGAYRILALFDPNGLAAQLAQLHHEVLNGTGYPFGVDARVLAQRGPAAELVRLITVADIFDAMTMPRPNTPVGMAPERALAILSSAAFADKLDPSIVAALRRLVEAGGASPTRTIPNVFRGIR